MSCEICSELIANAEELNDDNAKLRERVGELEEQVRAVKDHLTREQDGSRRTLDACHSWREEAERLKDVVAQRDAEIARLRQGKECDIDIDDGC